MYVIRSKIKQDGSLVIPEGTMYITNLELSYCLNLVSVTIPASVKGISGGAFAGCINLEKVFFSGKMPKIGKGAFSGCFKIQESNAPNLNIFEHSVWLRMNVKKIQNGEPVSGETRGYINNYIKNKNYDLAGEAARNPELMAYMCDNQMVTPKIYDWYCSTAKKMDCKESLDILEKYGEKENIKRAVEDHRRIINEKIKEVKERRKARKNKVGIDGLNFSVYGKLETFSDYKKLSNYLSENGACLKNKIDSDVDYLITNRSDISALVAVRKLGIQKISEKKFNSLANRKYIIEGEKIIRYIGDDVNPEIPAGITEIGNDAFSHTPIRSIVIPEGVVSIGEAVFASCSKLEAIVIADSVTKIGAYTFHRCEKLHDIKLGAGINKIPSFFLSEACTGADETVLSIPENVISIGDNAFWRSGIETIEIFSDMKEVGTDLFGFTGNICRICFRGKKWAGKPGDFKKYYSHGGIETEADSIESMPDWLRKQGAGAYMEEKTCMYGIAEEEYVEYIRKNATKLFLLAVNSEKSLSYFTDNKLITAGNFKKIYDRAEKYNPSLCPSLIYYALEEKFPNAETIEYYISLAEGREDPDLIASVLNYAGESISDEDYEKKRQKEDEEADLIFERTLARMDKKGIEGLNFAHTGYFQTFSNRTEFKNFLKENGATLVNVINAKTDYLVSDYADSETYSDTNTDKARKLGIEIITEERFNEIAMREFKIVSGKLISYFSKSDKVTVPEGVTAIGEMAFYNNNDITDVILPSSVKEIGFHAFSDCTSLERIILPYGLKKIEVGAFHNCRNLLSIYIPDSVISIAYNAFFGCDYIRILMFNPGRKPYVKTLEKRGIRIEKILDET